MESFYEFAKGPLFRIAFSVMVVGILRHFLLFVMGLIKTLRSADSAVQPYAAPFSKLAKNAVSWFVPVTKIKNRPLFSLTSMVFHAGLIIVPLFLFAHIQLWEEGTGFQWPALNQAAADWISLIVIATGLGLFISRLADGNSRALSRPQDFFMPVLLIIPFITGYMAMHPALNPVPYTLMMIIHVLSGEIILALIPFTKLSHMILFPFTQFASNYAWRFVPTGGEDVLKSLGKEGRV